MKTYSTSDLVRAIGDVTHAAVTEPVVITHHAKPRYVLMSIAAYERLAKNDPDPRRVYRAGEAPAELADRLLAAIDQTMAGLEPDDGA
ncbi:MAG: type II toxin-antitoxin system Phd/YefM family antitoxin [Caulobacteraceae bacterium]|nr:type II toxin-antitoxin system Phd/YefM family antitoxin [Caulobacteraceae bacterium]